MALATCESPKAAIGAVAARNSFRYRSKPSFGATTYRASSSLPTTNTAAPTAKTNRNADAKRRIAGGSELEIDELTRLALQHDEGHGQCHGREGGPGDDVRLPHDLRRQAARRGHRLERRLPSPHDLLRIRQK